jgi:membrane-bound lytic murein transglycosylase B
VIAVASLSAATAKAETPGHSGTRSVAAVEELGPAAPLAPFAAKPVSAPLEAPTATSSASPNALVQTAAAATGGSASAPVSALPRNVDVSATSIPLRALAAYVNATTIENATDPACHLQWQTLAGIGFVESDHARSGGSASPTWNGVADPPIYGPLLDGSDGFAAVPDTDRGVLDGNAKWDRAVGPMQFIPSTWERWAADGNHDGIENPQDIDDATLAAADYLCAAGGGALDQPAPLIRAVHAYNHSYSYVKTVLTVQAHYEDISPKKLGVNGLPKSHSKRRELRMVITVPPAQPTASTPGSNPKPKPSNSPSASPSPRPSPTTTPTPTRPPRTYSPAPSPSPTATLGGHLPQH